MNVIKRKLHFSYTDILLGALLFGVFAWIIYRIHVKMDYKWNWDLIPQYLFRFDPEKNTWSPNLIMQGFFTTIRLSFWAMSIALVLGIIMGICRTSRSLFHRLMGGTYVELTRNLPPLVLIFIFYYFISSQFIPVIGIEDAIGKLSGETKRILAFLFCEPSLFPAFFSALITLAIFEGAYITEIVRAGIQAIGKEQREAAAGLGMSRYQRMRYVILPQAIPAMLPPLAGQFVSTIKDSAIVSIISIPELTFQGMELMSATYLTFEIWITVTILYLVLTLSCSFGVGRLERHFRKV